MGFTLARKRRQRRMWAGGRWRQPLGFGGDGGDSFGNYGQFGPSSRDGVGWLEELYQGMAACLKPFATPLVGGDVCRASEISLSITAFGSVTSAIYRHQARVGDAIVVSGVHGASRAGLELLLNDLQWGDLDPQIRENLISAHQRPRPRLDLLEPLQRLGIGRIAGMDSSDGLGDAVMQLAHESGVKAQLWGDRLPSPPAYRRWFLQSWLKIGCYGAERILSWCYV